MNADEAMHWLLQGKLRQQLLLSLHQPHTIGQLSKKLGVAIGLCTRSMRHLVVYRLVGCMTPQRNRHRLYWLTDIGADCQQELLQHHALPTISHVLPELEYALYAEVCSRYRRALIKSLIYPMKPVEARRKAVREDPSLRMSANNARDTLRTLLLMHVVERRQMPDSFSPRYRLTGTGKHLQHLLWRSEEQPWPGLLKI